MTHTTRSALIGLVVGALAGALAIVAPDLACSPAQTQAAIASREAYGRALRDAGHGAISTEIQDAPPFYYAEEYHQQYLAKNPHGYCGHGGTGVACPIGIKTF